MESFNDIEKALWKKAMGGYEIEETVLEYQADEEDENAMKLVKKRVTKKTALPDSATLKLLLDQQNSHDPYASVSVKELQDLKESLIQKLKRPHKTQKNKEKT